MMVSGCAGERRERVASTAIAAPRKIALLKEWHASLSEIAARDPLAIETRRTMAHIETELRELGDKENRKKM